MDELHSQLGLADAIRTGANGNLHLAAGIRLAPLQGPGQFLELPTPAHAERVGAERHQGTSRQRGNGGNLL